MSASSVRCRLPISSLSIAPFSFSNNVNFLVIFFPFVQVGVLLSETKYPVTHQT